MSIPAMIVPILNRPDLLDRMLASIDHPVDRVVVIDNGDVVDPLTGGRHQYPFVVRVIQPGHNLGVGASWNLGIKATAYAPWWFVANFDLEWGPGDLARLEAMVDPRAAIVYRMFGYAAFALTPHALREIGWFDENLHPAYNDDLDYDRRRELAGIGAVETGFTGTHVGSATIHSDTALRRANGFTHGQNDAYYAAKWGGPKQGGETFTTPFNRGGHVGDWRLDIHRLRDQAWPDKRR